MSSPDLTGLSVAIGDYPHVRAFKAALRERGADLADVKPISRAFAPMVREGRYDVSEMAIATFLQAKAFGKSIVALPVVLAARYQEAALLCRRANDVAGPRELAGRRVGVRAYSQTTGMWLRGILMDRYGVKPDAIRWLTFEDAHVAEYRDPVWAERAPAGSDLMAMLRDSRLEAAIVGNDVPDSPELRTVFADVAGAADAFSRRHGFMPPNHLLTVSGKLAESRPEVVRELLEMMRASSAAAPPGGFEVVTTPETLTPATALAIRYSEEQDLLRGDLSPVQFWAGLPVGIAT